MSDLIKPTYDELLALVRRNYELILDPDPDSNVVDRHEIDLEHALRNAGIDTAAMQAAAEGVDEDEDTEEDEVDEDHETDRLYDLAFHALNEVNGKLVAEYGPNSPIRFRMLQGTADSFIRAKVDTSDLSDKGKAAVVEAIEERVAQLQNN